MKKKLLILLVVVLVLSLSLALAGCGKSDDTEQPQGDATDTIIRVGATPAPHAEILEAIKPALEAEGYTLEITQYNDYILPNTAVEEGDLDANYFQHITYMNDFNTNNGTHLASVGAVHYEPMGIYGGKVTALADLKDGATIAVPNDPTNEARALLLLEAQGLIKLKEGVGILATALDVEENKLNIKFQEVEAAQVPRVLQDVDVAVINGNYAIAAGLKMSETLAIEAGDSAAGEAYANVLTVKAGNESADKIQALYKALTSAEAKAYIEENYDGAVVPLF